jgi:uncharacterized protein
MRNKQGKYEQLCAHVQGKKNLMVALSGGIDSSLVSAIALQILGKKNTLAVTIDSELFPTRERKTAQEIAKKIGIRHIIKKVPLLTKTLCQNTPQRCYQCKKMMAEVLWDIAQMEQLDTIADGITQDDLQDTSYVGVKAWTDAGIWHPLAQYGFTQTEIYTLAKEYDLDTRDMPPEACLATRIAPYEVITPKKLGMIEEAEDYLKKYVPQVRVRMHHDLARIEVHPQDSEIICGMKKIITQTLKEIGFRHVTLDLEGYKKRTMTVSVSLKKSSQKKS